MQNHNPSCHFKHDIIHFLQFFIGHVQISGMVFEEGNFWFSHFPIREAFLFALKAEFTCHHSLKSVPIMTFLFI